MKSTTIKLLLVDDVKANLFALEQLVEAPDRTLIRAKSGEEALEILLNEQDFAVILMDVQMPGLNGFDTVNLLKAKENCRHIPILFLTAFDKEGAMETEAYSSGAVDYVMKPIQPLILTSKVDVFVDLYKSRQTLARQNRALEQANIKLIHEISLREQAEASLRLADQAIQNTHESVVITNAAGVIEHVNPAFCRLSGFTKHELINREIISIAAKNNPKIDHALISATLQGQGDWTGELRGSTKNGDNYTTWTHISGIYNKNKTLTHYCAILSEVNAPKKTELTLQKVKLRLEQAQHISHLGAWEWNRCESDIYCSDELFHILDTSPEKISPTLAACLTFIHPEDKNTFEKIITSLKAGHASDSKLRLQLADGSERTIHEQTEVHCNAQGEILQLIGTIHDITEQSKLEESFMQAQKMEAVGALVSGIAHEFNNILAGMNGHMYLAKRNKDNGDKVSTHITQLETLISRASETIKQMLTFSRKGIIKMNNLCLNTLIHETLQLHRSSISEHIALDHAICDEDLMVYGDNTLIQQLILNLIINARDAVAMASAPSIMIRLQHIETDDAFLATHADAKSGAYAQITVRDNGCGIDPSHQDKVFEPFYTSKGNQGTGLGLSMVYGAVKSHHGFIELQTQLGQGSNFHIYLPLLEQALKPQKETPTTQLIQGNGQCILIADDEEVVRNMARSTLETLGYTTIIASDGEQAVALFSKHQDDIQLVILDIIMPKRNGKDTAIAIRDIQPDMPIVFITGYNEERSLGKWVNNHETIITKPFSIHAFSQIVADNI